MLATIGISVIIIILIIAIFCVIRIAGISSQNEEPHYYEEQAKALQEYKKKK